MREVLVPIYTNYLYKIFATFERDTHQELELQFKSSYNERKGVTR